MALLPITRFASSAALLALTTTVVPVHASTGNAPSVLVPVCTNGGLQFMEIALSNDEDQKPENDEVACHGPCICTRKKGPQLPAKRR